MKAFVANAYGGPEVMALTELPEPMSGPAEVVVEVRASSVNPVDWKVRSGAMRLLTGGGFPRALGCDFAGVIARVGSKVMGWSAGDRVYGFTPIMLRKPGAHAERLRVVAKGLRRIPEGLEFEEAAALPVAGLTALNGLEKCGPVAGRAVLVIGATGGVGHFAVQLAKARGARVTAVCSGRNAEQARALGAQRTIDYRGDELGSAADRYDVVFDAYGHFGFGSSRRLLAPRGIYVTTLGSPTLFGQGILQTLSFGPRIVFANVRDRQGDYAALEQEVLAGRVKPIVSRVFALGDAAQAFAALESGGTVGKIVLRIT